MAADSTGSPIRGDGLSTSFSTALSAAATLADKLRVSRFRSHTTSGDLHAIYSRPEVTTMELLRRRRFSDKIITRFFRPFLGGVFLDGDLETSSRLCEFVFRMFSLGDAAVPRLGMEQIPQQLAAALPAESVRCEARVQQLTQTGLILEGGEAIEAAAVVVSTDAMTADRLLSGQPAAPAQTSADVYPQSACRGVQCLYFAADRSPVREAILVLNGESDGPINNLCVASDVSSDYAPAGQSLISVTVLGTSDTPTAVLSAVRQQLQSWFGNAVNQWRHLKTYSIPYALPNQQPPALDPVAKPSQVREQLFVCGDHCDTGSINGAMASGRRAAEAVAAQLSNSRGR